MLPILHVILNLAFGGAAVLLINLYNCSLCSCLELQLLKYVYHILQIFWIPDIIM